MAWFWLWLRRRLNYTSGGIHTNTHTHALKATCETLNMQIRFKHARASCTQKPLRSVLLLAPFAVRCIRAPPRWRADPNAKTLRQLRLPLQRHCRLPSRPAFSPIRPHCMYSRHCTRCGRCNAVKALTDHHPPPEQPTPPPPPTCTIQSVLLAHRIDIYVCAMWHAVVRVSSGFFDAGAWTSRQMGHAREPASTPTLFGAHTQRHTHTSQCIICACS